MRRRELLKAIPLLMTPALARADTRPLGSYSMPTFQQLIPSGPPRWWPRSTATWCSTHCMELTKLPSCGRRCALGTSCQTTG